MATTTKTLTPTNQTITLPDMTERPNASILVDGIGKDADAINALSDQMANIFTPGTKQIDVTTLASEINQYTGTYTFTSAELTGVKTIIPLYARKSGKGYICTLAFENDTLRVQSSVSLEGVNVGYMVVK